MIKPKPMILEHPLSTEELLQVQSELEHAHPLDVLRWAQARFRRLALVASFQAESSVLIDLASRLPEPVEILTIDTHKLPQETHQVIERFRQRYRLPIRILTPDPDQVGEMVRLHGENLYFKSPTLRRHCCEVRKGVPLLRALEGYDAWLTGLRREQAASRARTPVVDIDAAHGGIAKIAPLATWTKDQVWEHIRSNDVPHHPLYTQSYTSIGCTPCTRATTPGEDERAGRWWWEQEGEVKECGLHWAQAPTTTPTENSRPKEER